MKIAITSTGDTLTSFLDPRFGRCSFFVIYDTESKETVFIPNEGKTAEEGAGPVAVQQIASCNVEKVVSGEFGIKIKSLLSDLNIQMILLKDKKDIQSIIDLLNH
ncbi:NifB/NifX family molybdenum-iron cluster-binding protein [uncultured Bacteroides sp.]|uniref:NifB/NifX family molybdenum-iron cluster-binding protein n=1 Tax=uncultured Bacteroides sp. TaxID=162156 RepID=UPI002AABB750|nr:NifB/NifX family molybdenum-iron cluster-binding protein [uncultured Bacteroides sp.]